MYSYMLKEIESACINTSRSCELNKAWYGLHYALNGGLWTEDDSVSSKIIFSGKFLLDDEVHVISLKNTADVKEIVSYLRSLDNLEEVITEGFNNTKSEDLDLPKDDNLLEFLHGWSSELISFYVNALDNNFNVIFSVDI